MCRLAAYTGPDIPLHRFLTDPGHSLLVQAWGPQEMAEAALNADGFGFGWYGAGGQPEKYVNTCPMWSDINLGPLGRSLKSGLWLANVRSATPGQAVGLDNTQPFIDGPLMYLHNGYIRNFGPTVKTAFHARLRPAIQAGIRGNTDSEYLFALFRQELEAAAGDPLAALQGTLAVLPDLLEGTAALVNLVLSDGRGLTACRYAFNEGRCPTLYSTDRHPDFPGAVLIASERLSRPDAWEAVAENAILTVSPGHGITHHPL